MTSFETSIIVPRGHLGDITGDITNTEGDGENAGDRLVGELDFITAPVHPLEAERAVSRLPFASPGTHRDSLWGSGAPSGSAWSISDLDRIAHSTGWTHRRWTSSWWCSLNARPPKAPLPRTSAG
jgi:hypothetical protein